MKHTIFPVIMLLFAFQFLQAQSIQNDVISSGGASVSTATLKMDYTIGEPVIETFSTGGNVLTQGFHQPNITLTSIEKPESLNDIQVFPNPVEDELTIEIPAQYESAFIYRLFDINGKLLVQSSVFAGSHKLYMHSYAAGTYILQITNMSSGEQINSKMLKNQ
jgi:hypothetical protein